MEHAASSSIETRVASDGIAYSWAEFDNYFDADMAAEIREAAQVVAPPAPAQTFTSPRFELGSIVRVLADTTPGVHPMHAEGILVAKVLDFADEGHYYVAPIDSKKRRRLSGALLIPTSIDTPPLIPDLFLNSTDFIYFETTYLTTNLFQLNSLSLDIEQTFSLSLSYTHTLRAHTQLYTHSTDSLFAFAVFLDVRHWSLDDPPTSQYFDRSCLQTTCLKRMFELSFDMLNYRGESGFES